MRFSIEVPPPDLGETQPLREASAGAGVRVAAS
jgi:hypothetical protein